jgi:capsular exopolysaccharide synthesis family protein
VVDELEKPDVGSSPVRIWVVEPALVSVSPSSPNVPINLAAGLVLSLLAGIGGAALRSILDTRLRSQEDMERVSGKPMLGMIAFDPEARKRPLLVHMDSRNPRSEAFRRIRTGLMFANVEGSAQTVIVSSAGPSEGKSVTTSNLAIALAESGFRVLLIDCDLHRPRVATYMGIEGGAGLTDVLIGRASLEDVIQRWGRDQLFVLPAGRQPPNPSRLLGSATMQELHRVLDRHYDYILIDSPPLLLTTDAAVLSRTLAADVVLVGAYGKTKKQDLAAAVRSLDSIDSQVLGVVMTMTPAKTMESYGSGDYGYGYGEEDRFNKRKAKKRTKRRPMSSRPTPVREAPSPPVKSAPSRKPARKK